MSGFNERIGILEYLARRSRHGWIGRTALMKMCYFVQELRGVPLGYNFSLYSYGPFDSAVLGDLGEAEALGVVKEDVISYPSGYGYKISSAIGPEIIAEIGGELLQRYRNDIDFILTEYGDFTAADLELASTLIYADREAARINERISTAELARRVKEVKPRFSSDQILQHAESLKRKRFLSAAGE
jgi:hypothetical protein